MKVEAFKKDAESSVLNERNVLEELEINSKKWGNY